MKSLHRGLLIVFFCCTGIICQAFKLPTHRFYVLQDPLNQHEFTVGGVPGTALERHGPAWKVYAPSFLHYSTSNEVIVEIKQAGKSIVSKKCVPGSYVINLNPSQLVLFSELAYGRQVKVPSKSLKPSPTGIYFIDASTSLLVFDFGQEPPDSIKTRGSLKDRQFIKLDAVPAK